MIFWRLVAVFSSVWPAMFAAIVLSLLTVAANVGLMAMSAYLITMAALKTPVSLLATSIVGVRFFGISRAVCRYLERYVSHSATFQILSRIRVWVYRSLEPIVPAGLTGVKNADIFSMIIHDVETLKFFFLRILLPPAVALLMLVCMLLFLSFFSDSLVWLLIAAFILSVIVLPLLLAWASRGAGAALPKAKSLFMATMADSVGGIRDLKAFGQVKNQERKMMTAQAAFRHCLWRNYMVASLADLLGMLLMNITAVSAVIIVIPLVRQGSLHGVYLAVLALAIQSCFEAWLPIAAIYRYWDESKTSFERLLTLLDKKPEHLKITEAIVRPDYQDLIVEDVKFCYPGRSTWAIDGVSFSLTAGKRIAVVGPSGSGKSSVISILLRLWNYDQGSIRLGSHEISDYDAAILRESFGTVLQNDHIFNASIADNIRLSRPQATAEEVNAAAIQAGLGRLMNRLPLGLAEVIGENGVGLSGGERRRISIARALLKNAPILILDEPAAGLDAITEQEVMTTIEAVTVGKSTILITHNLAGLETMDEILVMDRGTVVERGRQSALLAQKGLFYTLWHLQNDLLEEFACDSLNGSNT